MVDKPEEKTALVPSDNYADSVIWEELDNPIKRFVQHIYHAVACKYFYLILFLLNLALGIWVVVSFINESFPEVAFYVFEFGISIILFFDVCLRMWVNGWTRYWRSLSNIFEVCLVVICLSLSIITISCLLFVKV